MKRYLVFLFFGLAAAALAGIIYGGLTMVQIVTPANPASGSNKLYFKSDNKLYSLTSAGTETEIGAGGSAFNPLDMSTFWFREEFTSARFAVGVPYAITGDMTTWSGANIGSPSGADFTAPNDANTHANPGQVQIHSGTVAGAGRYLSMDPYNYGQGLVSVSDTTWHTRVVFKLSSTTQITAQLAWVLRGEMNVQDGGSIFGLYYSAAGSGGDYLIKSKSYGGTTGTWDTGVAATTGFRTFDLRSDGTKLYASFDGGAEVSFCPSGCTITATLPPTVSDYVFVGSSVTADGTDRIVSMDAVAHIGTLAGATAAKRN